MQVYIDNHQSLFSHDNSQIARMRSEAAQDFKRLKLPSRRDEEYRYADTHDIFTKAYRFYFQHTPLDTPPSCLFQCDVPQLDAHTLFLVNGFYLTDAGTSLNTLPSGAIYGSLQEAIKLYPHIVFEYLNRISNSTSDGLVPLSTCLMVDGLFLYIPEGVTLDKPFQIISLLQGEENRFINNRHLLIAEPHSNVQIILCDHSLSPAHFLTNTVWEVYVRDRANLEFITMQNQHNEVAAFFHLFADVQDNAAFTQTTITLHGGFLRSNIYASLNGEGIVNTVNGLALVDGDQYVDMHTVVNHQKRNCHSSQLYKTILDDNAQATFYGLINVHQDAQKTQAYQRNANVLLTDNASINTRPQLIIYADDVKCSHGATIGQLDEQAMFYMQSRGIPPKEAKRLLLLAFVQDILDSLHIQPLRSRIEHLVQKRLRGERDSCFQGGIEQSK